MTTNPDDYNNNNDDLTFIRISKLVSGCNSSNLQKQLECTRQIRKFISSPINPPIQAVVDSGIIPRIIQFCKRTEFPELQYESLWVLVNVASGPAECTAYILRQNAHSVLIELLQNPFYEICEQALWALGNIAGEGQDLIDLLLHNNVLQRILPICTAEFNRKFVSNFNHILERRNDLFYEYKSLLVTAAWTLSNLCRSPPPTKRHLEDLIKCLQCVFEKALNLSMYSNPFDVNTKFSVCKQDEIISNVGWSFSYLTLFDEYSAFIIDKMQQLGMLQQFVMLMDHNLAIVRHPINRIIANILAGNQEDTKLCLSLGVLSKYKGILTNLQSTPRELRDICWTISNVCAGPMEQKLLVLKSGLYQILIAFLKDKPYECAKQALWAIGASLGLEDIDNVESVILKPIIKALVEFDVLNALTIFLRKKTFFSKLRINELLVMALDCIEKIIIDGDMQLCTNNNVNIYAPVIYGCDVVQCLEYLQLQKDEENIISDVVYRKCRHIINGTQDIFKVYNKYYVMPLVFGYVKQIQIDCKLSKFIPTDIVQTLLLFSLLNMKVNFNINTSLF